MPEAEPDPVEFAVPELFVPGVVAPGTLLALPTPLGSLTELFRLPGFPGPLGTPLIAADQLQSNLHWGDPAAVGAARGGSSLAAPVAEPTRTRSTARSISAACSLYHRPPPPLLCAKAATGMSIAATKTNLDTEVM